MGLLLAQPLLVVRSVALLVVVIVVVDIDAVSAPIDFAFAFALVAAAATTAAATTAIFEQRFQALDVFEFFRPKIIEDAHRERDDQYSA